MHLTRYIFLSMVLAARLELGHYTNAGRGPSRWSAAQRRRYDEAPAELRALATKEISG
ncbi:MAG: hypothetical protein ACLQVY_10660 [Limisphaerales bacterium]